MRFKFLTSSGSCLSESSTSLIYGIFLLPNGSEVALGVLPNKVDWGSIGEISFIGFSWSKVCVLRRKFVFEGIPADALFLIMMTFFQLTVWESWSSQDMSATAILGGAKSGASDFLAFFFGFLASGETGSSAGASSFFFFDFFAFGCGAESKIVAALTILLLVTSLKRVLTTLLPN